MTLDTSKAIATRNDLTAIFRTHALQAQPYYPRVCTVAPSSTASEDVGLPGAVPQIREWLGGRAQNRLRGARFTLTHGHYEGTLEIDRTDWEDDRMGMHRIGAAQLGQRAALHPDKLLVDTIEAGAATACWDGQFFYDTDHSWGASGTQSNDLTYDCVAAATPTVAEFKAALRQAVDAIIAFVDDQGENFYQPTVDRLSSIEVNVPTALRSVAIDATEALFVGGGDTNVRIDQYKVRCIPRLSSGVKFWVHLTSDIIRPYIFYGRTPIREEIEGLDSIKEKYILMMTEARYSLGYLAWWNSVLTELTTA